MKFYKYQACGNDFIVLDNRTPHDLLEEQKRRANLCSRTLGIGADGILCLENSETSDYTMRYYNADGNEVGMCGNGARTLAQFASRILNIPLKNDTYVFKTQNGVYSCRFPSHDSPHIHMTEISDFKAIKTEDLIKESLSSSYINTGVPHCLFFLPKDELTNFDVETFGRKVRYEKRFSEGVNSNFVSEVSEGHLKIRTYERGVEGETLSCGTGAVAASIAYKEQTKKILNLIQVESEGGILSVSFDHAGIWLSGPVKKVFEGQIELESFF